MLRLETGAELRDLSQISSKHSITDFLCQYAIIIATFGLCALSSHWAVWAIAGIVLATRQHALAVLVHEGVHFRLFPKKWLNDVWSDVFYAFPIFMSTELYRQTHWSHHEYLNSEKDPDWVFMKTHPDWRTPQTRVSLLRVFLRDLFLLNIKFNLRDGPVPQLWSPLPRLFKKNSGLALKTRFLFVAYYTVLFSFLSFFGLWKFYLILWVLPSLTVLNVIFRIRTLVEHQALPGSSIELSTRSTTTRSLLEKFLFAPCHINLHREHHLFPAVPHYRLPRLREKLAQHKDFLSVSKLDSSSYLGRFGALSCLSMDDSQDEFREKSRERLVG
jgi:fatty acid desaturase